MGERKVFKTKLCVLYEKGHCPRQTCSFAHGDDQLRRFNGRRDYRGVDLRDKLKRRYSPLQRYSPGRDVRDRHASRGLSPREYDEKRSSDRKRQNKQHFDGQSDRSGSVPVSDRTQDRIGKIKLMSSDPKNVMGEQLRQAQAEIDALNNQKCQLKINLNNKVQEVDTLTSRIQELKNQLFQEKEECKRMTWKINKFVTEHTRHSRLQDNLKRSFDLLQKMGDQLTSDATGLGINEDTSSLNIFSDGETNGGGMKETTRLKKHSHWSEQHAQFDNEEEADQRDKGSNGHKILLNGIKSKRGKMDLTKAASEQKDYVQLRGREPGFSLPLTSMAAHVIDQGIKTADQEIEDLEITETPSVGYEKRASYEKSRFPLPPPLPLLQNSYAQYRGEDENLDVDAVDDDMLEVDID